jgi:hypothetical protein
VDRGPSARVRAARSRNEAGGAAFGGIFVELRDLVAVGGAGGGGWDAHGGVTVS